jgi:peptide deformylase
MVLPIVVYGDPVLRKKCVNIEPTHDNLPQLIQNMYETMYEANGVGLAAPQIGKALRLFVIDASPFAEVDEDEEPEFTAEEMKQMNGFKKTFINALITEENGEEWKLFYVNLI